MTPSARLTSLALALVHGDAESAAALVTDAIVWETIGGGTIRGIAALREALAGPLPAQVTSATVDEAVADERGGWVRGAITLKNGRTRAFVDLYEFAEDGSMRIRRVVSCDIGVA